MENALPRRIALLNRLPVGANSGTGCTVRELTAMLEGSEYECTRRTVERDLVAIRDEPEWKQAGVTIQQRSDGADSRSSLWSLAPGSKAVLFQVQSREDAMLLGLLEQELKYFMPASACASLQRHLQSSAAVLSLPANQRQSTFRDRIRVLPDSPVLRGPEPSVDHLQAINEALLHEEQVDMRYWSSSDKTVKSYRLHPVGLVKQGLFFWLLAVKEENAHCHDGPGPVQKFRVDRIESVARRKQEVVARRLPTLSFVLDEGAMGHFDTGLIALKVRFAPNRSGTELCANYRDTPLSDDQAIVTLPDGILELSATVRYSRQLVWMLQGQASLLRVIEPAELQEEIGQFIQAAAAFQGATTPA